MNSPSRSLYRGWILATRTISAIISSAVFHFKARAITNSSPQQVLKYEILHAFTGNAGYGFNGEQIGAKHLILTPEQCDVPRAKQWISVRFKFKISAQTATDSA